MTRLTQRIVVATDFSEASEPALRAAAVLAVQNAAELVLLHVLVPDGTVEVIEDPVSGLIMPGDEARAELSAELAKLAERELAQVARVELTVIVGTSPADAICEHAEKIGADMIVVGTHGRTGLSRMLIGSVAERVVRHASCPVLTLRTRAR